ncbi:MAG: bifunctional isocitrate dehydrogenase kinase/phosphatase [Rhodothermaceae bacterium]|nr:bifunctional isocitrate dehydrogenase kinase/phosphatase [Rhodothermaceae bacterium]
MPDAAPHARTILDGFDRLQDRFAAVTLRARTRFEARDWGGLRADHAERIDLYAGIVGAVVDTLHGELAGALHDKPAWAAMKAAYAALVAGRPDWELAETFFNSITRRIFTTVGVDPQIEFVASEQQTPPPRPVCHVWECDGTVESLFRGVLDTYAFAVPYEDAERDAAALARAVKDHLRAVGAVGHVDRVELAEPVFFRADGAYLVGWLFAGGMHMPIALALRNDPPEKEDPAAYEGPGGIRVDALLLGEDEVSILFSFARSYFLVDTDRVYDLVRFLKTLLPRKRVAELYIVLGHNKHGKTELYRDLLRHLAQADPDERFVRAPGQPGMVMITFTMPGYDMVFKLIKDRFDPPKTVSRQQVLDSYRLVFRHDRAGRLVDAQPFEHLRFARTRFSEALLAELLDVAPSQVEVGEGHVDVAFLYMERQVTPLDLYVRQHGDAAAPAVIDYGHAIKDLAASGIFPGDLLLKNFGVTRHGRVVFYDYDELGFLTDYDFRNKPEPQHEWQEMAAEPWFYVGERDVFPEEFEAALGLPASLRAVFKAHHADLLGPDFWNAMKERQARGEPVPIVPYPEQRRLGTDPREHVRTQAPTPLAGHAAP